MAYRIMEISKSFDDDVFYRASCMCGSKNCDMVLELEYIKDLDEIVLNIYKDVYWSDYGFNNTIFKKIWSRIKASFRVLFTGYIKMEEEFIFENEEQIKEFTSTIESGIIRINEKRLITANKS